MNVPCNNRATDEGLDSQPAVENRILPVYIRLPKSGTLCPWTGLSRSHLNQIILPSAANDWQPQVRSFSIRTKPGAWRGVRMIVFASLLEFLEQHQKQDRQFDPAE